MLLCSSPVLLLVVVVFLFLLQLLWRGCVCWCVQASSCLLLYSATVLLNSARCDRSIGGSLHAWMDGWMDGWMNRLLMNKTDLIAAAKHDYLKHCEEIFVDTGSVEVRSVVRSLAFVGSQVRATTQPNLLIAQDHRSGCRFNSNHHPRSAQHAIIEQHTHTRNDDDDDDDDWWQSPDRLPIDPAC